MDEFRKKRRGEKGRHKRIFWALLISPNPPSRLVLFWAWVNPPPSANAWKKTFFMSSLMLERWKASLFLKYVEGNVHNGLHGEQCVYLDTCLSPFLESESNTHDGLHSEGGSQGCVANIPDICHLHYMWCMCKTFQTCVKVPDWIQTL